MLSTLNTLVINCAFLMSFIFGAIVPFDYMIPLSRLKNKDMNHFYLLVILLFLILVFLWWFSSSSAGNGSKSHPLG